MTLWIARNGINPNKHLVFAPTETTGVYLCADAQTGWIEPSTLQCGSILITSVRKASVAT